MQSRRWSLIETCFSTFVGFGLAILANYFLMPVLFGVKPTMIGNLAYTLVFTIISMVRQYTLRRFFNWIQLRFNIK